MLGLGIGIVPGIGDVVGVGNEVRVGHVGDGVGGDEGDREQLLKLLWLLM